MAKKIVIVDENENSVTITKPNGQKSNFSVEVALRAEDFRGNKQEQTLHQVIMPGVNEFESPIKINADEETAFLPIVLVTTLNQHQELEPGNNYNVIKPHKFESLINSINDVTDIVSKTIRKQVIQSVKNNFPQLQDDIVRNEKNPGRLPENLFKFVMDITQNNKKDSEFKETVNNSEITFRLLKPADHTLLHDFYNTISQESIAFQEFQPAKTFPDESIHTITTLNSSREVALGAFTIEDGKETLTGFTYCKASVEGLCAQFALLVQDEWQTRGISSFLLTIITEIAKARGVSEFHAVIYKKRKRILPLFYDSGHTVCIKKESNVYKVNYKINRKWIVQHYKNSDNKAYIRLEDK